MGTAPQIPSATEPDWSRERPTRFWDPGRRLLRTIRGYQRCRGPVGKLIKPWYVFWYRFWTVVTGTDIPLNAQLGGGLLLPHPNGVVIHPDAVIGINCLILQQVTIGSGSKPGLPVIGGHVDICAGAKVLGGIRIGDHAKIGANAVVMIDVPEGATAVGIPARIIPTKKVEVKSGAAPGVGIPETPVAR
jgi:serine O-acetyltransferase